MISKFIGILFGLGLFASINGLLAVIIGIAGMYPNLPELDDLEDYRPRLPLRVFSADGELLGEFGEEKRKVVALGEIPPLLVQALIATEDQDYYQHLGLDVRGIVRTVITRLQGGVGGASTLTMQVARNFYLEREQTYIRKIYEILLALKIENQFSKERILEFYMNQIYLGRGNYGFAAAAQGYYGKQMTDLSLAEIAVLAGLPQAPSRLNPARNPELAKERQKHVLRRMRTLNFISDAEFLEASAAPLPTVINLNPAEQEQVTTASFVAEEVRKLVFDAYGDEAYERGFRVYTTIDMRLQRAASLALRKGLIDYTLRHAYGGPERYHDISGMSIEQVAGLLDQERVVGGLVPAIVMSSDRELVQVVDLSGQLREIGGDGLKFVAKALPKAQEQSTDSDQLTLRPGAQVRLATLPGAENSEPYLAIVQIPKVQGALVSVSPDDGRVLAMAGGFDFTANQYNHVTQAKRQPGSSIKPFIYSAALERGFTPATILDDAPFFLTAEQTGSGKSWAPRNYSGKYEGKLLLRMALARSKNMTTIRVLDSISPEYAQDYISRFGFARESLPPYLTMALGAGEVTPLQLAASYAVFANGGYLVVPHFVSRVEDFDGNIVTYTLDFARREQIIDRRNAYLISNLLQSVVTSGTARKALSLGRKDLAGKTGTTNETVDAWFAGFNPELVAVVWVGYDTPRSLGRIETGSRAALPIWIDYMRDALTDRPDGQYVQPSGIVEAQIDSETGLLASSYTEKIVNEYFYEEYLPSPAEIEQQQDYISELL